MLNSFCLSVSQTVKVIFFLFVCVFHCGDDYGYFYFLLQDAEKILKFGNIGVSTIDSDSDIDGVYCSDDENASVNIVKQDDIYDPLTE